MTAVMRRNTLALACGLGIFGSPIVAQDAGGIEEVVVTAQKREQSLQEVPIAISAISSEQIAKSGIADVKDVQALSPSLVFTSTQSEAAGSTARIRGVGTTGDNAGLESAVAIFVDGIYRNRNNVGLTELGEVERIEVMRGPQGTLFGKNASAGLIHVITKGPSFDERYGHAEIGGGNFGYLRGEFGYTAPFSDRAAWRFDAAVIERDGIVDDFNSGREYNNRDRYLFRGQLAFQPNDDVDIRIIADGSSRDEVCCAAVQRIVGPTGGLIRLLGGNLPIPADPFARESSVSQARDYQEEVDDAGISAEINWENGLGKLTSITAFRDWETSRSQDIDYTAADLLYRERDGYVQSFETLTQELRLTGGSDNFDWMVGLFYADEQLDYNDAVRVGADWEGYLNGLFSAATGLPNTVNLATGLPAGGAFVSGAGVIEDVFDQQADSLAFFTHNTWRINDSFSLGFGIRFTDETKELDATLSSSNPACLAGLGQAQAGNPLAGNATILGTICLPFFNPLLDGNYSDERSDEEWTGTVNLSWAMNDDWNSYVSFGRGFKAGGFNLDRAGLDNPLTGQLNEASDLQFEEEGVDSWELGLKGSLFDRRLNLNAALFYSDFEDFQLNTFTGISFIVDNLEGVTSQGLEVEFNSAIGDYFTLAGGFTVAETEYDDNVTLTNLAGRQITNAPEEVASLSGTYQRPLRSGMDWFVHLNGRYQGEVNTGSDLDAEKRQGGYTLWNARVGINRDDAGWEVEAWARNLGDKDYIQVAFDGPLQTGTFDAYLAEPRTYGATVRYRF